MDEIKDVAKKDRLSQFLDNRTLRIQPFGANISADRAYRRAERLVAAIHLVTNHIEAHEPARDLTRRSGLELLSRVLMLRDEMRNPESPVLKRAQLIIRKLISLVRILSVAGHISVQNAETLVEALDELSNFLVVSQRTAFSEGTVLSKEDLLDTEYTTDVLARPLEIMSYRKRTRSLKDKIKSGDRMSVSDKNDRTYARGERIVRVLTAQGQLGIKDISASLPEYSEKMIQRELKSLVTLGRVKKTGSKRWSMYTLA